MEREGATSNQNQHDNCDADIEDKLKSLEGMKCRAPHTHQWGDIAYHNALVCSVIPNDSDSKTLDDIEVHTFTI